MEYDIINETCNNNTLNSGDFNNFYKKFNLFKNNDIPK